ncbi:hypothetical protein NSZ01_34770 [Nocardioides szechwanensis]|uniref:DUF3017 domain-containing protein n=1 Tax=Nocardioides szechwanensis TaxID=1005944 RepID=A0A1H0G568_9ACTN|nr:DUF3017 domain-containing protein [Nocardioides szechwanensis]GEP35709.1 hypothetical protein NSZ01_34770 [Nocardioides szechwanensis]SDO02063.1 Protein of unknown function [Nocardioides szechwanensis]
MTDGPLPDDRPPEPPEDVEGAADGAEEEPQERRYPSTIGGAFYLLILITSAIGFGIVVSGNWRLGVRWLAASLMAGSALRLVLPERDAGMLAVRHRFIDCTLLAGVGSALFWLASSIPDQPL